MPIKSNHDIYLFNHRNFTNYIYDNRYGIYVPDRLLLYFTLYKNKLEDWKIIAILAVEKETGSFQLTPTRKSFFIITKSYGTRLGVESYISAFIFITSAWVWAFRAGQDWDRPCCRAWGHLRWRAFRRVYPLPLWCWCFGAFRLVWAGCAACR